MNRSKACKRRDLTAFLLGFIIIFAVLVPLLYLPSGSAIIWDSPFELSSDKRDEYQRYPAVAAEGGKTYAVWAMNDGKDYSIIFKENDGMGWQAEEEISASDMGVDQYNPDVAVDGGDVHVVWHDAVNGDWDIMYRKRTGGVWGPIEEVSVDISVEAQWYPKVAVVSGNVYVVWQDGRDGDWDVYFRFHNGVSWSTVTQVNVDSGSEDQTYPRITAGGGNAYVVWVDWDGGDKDILMRIFDGSIWGSEMEVSEDSTGEEQDEPDVSYDGGVTHIVWMEFETTDRDIFYRNYNDVSFSTVTEISIDSGTEFQRVPAISAQLGIAHAVWSDKGDGDWDIVYRQRNGTTWETPQEISSDVASESQDKPDIASDNGVNHVVWEDLAGGDNDIFYVRGEDISEDLFPPEIQSVVLDGLSTIYIPQGTSTVTLTATVDDSARGGHDIGGANFTWGEKMWMSSTIMDAYNALDSPTEDFYYDLDTSSLGIGTYELFVYGWDELMNMNIVGAKATLIVIPAINLEEGWNLVSFPQIVSETTLNGVLDSITEDYDAVQYYNTTDSGDSWKHHHISKPQNLNDLQGIDNKMGFWVHITKAGGTTLIVNGTLPTATQNVPLYSGWNHVGYPSLTQRDRTAGLNNLVFDVDVDSIWSFDAVTKQWTEIGPSDMFEVGMGYWIHAKTECEWNVLV